MNRTKCVLACAVLALVLSWPSTGRSAEHGHGETVKAGQITGVSMSGPITPSAGSQWIVVGTNSDGSLQMREMGKDRDYQRGPTLLWSDTCAVGMADSTLNAVTCGDVLHGALYIKIDGGGTLSTFALRVFACINGQSDTSSTFALPFRYSAITTGTVSGVTAGQGSDSLKVGTAILPTSVTAGSNEILLQFNDTALSASKWGTTKSICVPLAWLAVGPMNIPSIKVMVRCLSAVANSPKITVWYQGSPL